MANHIWHTWILWVMLYSQVFRSTYAYIKTYETLKAPWSCKSGNHIFGTVYRLFFFCFRIGFQVDDVDRPACFSNWKPLLGENLQGIWSIFLGLLRQMQVYCGFSMPNGTMNPAAASENLGGDLRETSPFSGSIWSHFLSENQLNQTGSTNGHMLPRTSHVYKLSQIPIAWLIHRGVS